MSSNMWQKMMRRFDASDERANDVRGDFDNTGQKVDAHAVSIKHLELKMAQLSTTVNPRQSGTLPSNTIQNLKNDRHCMVVITRGGKQTIVPPMPSVVEDEMRKNEKVLETSGELVDKAVKEVEVPQKVILIPRPPPPFPKK